MDDANSLTGVVVVLVVAVVYFHIKKFSFWSSRNVKGPMPWPIFGTNIYYMFDSKIKVDEKWNKKYGKVYGLYEGYSPLLMVNDAALINHIYVKQFRSFTDRHNEFIHNKVIRNWLLWAEGRDWSAKRPIAASMFSSAKMRLMANKMSTCVNRFLEEIERRRQDSKVGTNKINGASTNSNGTKTNERGVRMCKTDISSMTIDVIATNFYSLKVSTYNEHNNEFLKKAFDLAVVAVSRYFAWSLLPRQVAKFFAYDLFDYPKIQYFDMLAKKTIEDRRRASSEPKKFDFVQLFLDAKLPEYSEQAAPDAEETEVSLYSGQSVREQQKEIRNMNERPLRSLSDIEIRGQMNFMFVAGFETTAATLNFCLYELGHRPDIQERLHEELLRVFETDLDIIKDRSHPFPSENYGQLMDMTQLLAAFISEVLRLYSPIINNSRRTTKPVVLPSEPEIPLPVGVPITNNSYVVHRDPDYWEEPDKFDMTRFMPENRHKVAPGTYFPFGLGARHCLGMRFALLEIRMALAKLILNYHVLPVNMEYPPKFQQNPVFLLLEDNNFELVPRQS